jgi:putative cell wall-binding protein
VTAKVQTQLQAYTLGTVTRLSGHGRYATSAAISATVAPATAIAYIVNGASFADALSVGPVAGINAGRILVVQGNSIPASVAAELLRLQPTRIVVIGGTSSITAHVESLLHQYVH